MSSTPAPWGSCCGGGWSTPPTSPAGPGGGPPRATTPPPRTWSGSRRSRTTPGSRRPARRSIGGWRGGGGRRPTAAAASTACRCSAGSAASRPTPGTGAAAFPATRGWRERYLDLLKRSLTDYLHHHAGGDPGEWDLMHLAGGSAPAEAASPPPRRASPHGHSLTQAGNLNFLQLALEDLLRRRVEGDVLHAGCFRGGGGVLLRAVLGDDRGLWVADTFSGIPPPSTEEGRRLDDTPDWEERYSASLGEVQGSFDAGMLPDARIRFVVGPLPPASGRAGVGGPLLDAPH